MEEIDTPSPLPYVELGRSSKMERGDLVIAMGSPSTSDSSRLPISATSGIVSYIGDGFIIDRPVNLGTQGGPLFNLHGEVVGITSPKILDCSHRGNFGLTYVEPIDGIRKEMDNRDEPSSKTKLHYSSISGDQLLQHKFKESISKIEKAVGIVRDNVGEGSGTIIHEDGIVSTCAHCVGNKIDNSCVVETIDGQKFPGETIIMDNMLDIFE